MQQNNSYNGIEFRFAAIKKEKIQSGNLQVTDIDNKKYDKRNPMNNL
jgi:hypothetical protein